MFSLFLSPFLLFILELMAGKYYLLHFGGSSSVWITLTLFFTISLLLGCLYAVIVKPKTHIFIVLISTFYISYQFMTSGTIFLDPFTFTNPMVSLISNAFVSMGLTFIVLSSASSLLPLWSSDAKPYRYYSLSNLGSLLGLLSYPFLIEPHLPFKHQNMIWFMLYLINAIIIINVTRKTRLHDVSPAKLTQLPIKPVLYSLLSTAYFLVTTTALSQTVGPSPILWVAPLTLYLLSFIIVFNDPKSTLPLSYYPLAILLLSITFVITSQRLDLGNIATYLCLLITQFVVNLILHTKIYDSRPPKNTLPVFYVAISLGGALASLLNGVIAPTIFFQFQELPILITFCLLTFIYLGLNQIRLARPILVLIILLGLTSAWFLSIKKNQPQSGFSITHTRSRNFYGFLDLIEVKENNSVIERRLLSGKTIHGSQSYTPGKEQVPTEYYNKNTALGALFSKPIHRVGVIGLGVGTIAAYCNKGNEFTFYELDPDVIKLANTQFSYLSGCTTRGGNIKIVEGDARFSLVKEPSNSYDLLVVDAFTDDAIPYHLLTKEALLLYRSHLSENGIIAVHITNKYLDLKPTMVVTASSANLVTTSYSTPDAAYLLLSPRQLSLGNYEFPNTYPHVRGWTDDFTNVLQAIKW